jgi:putative membrane protein
MSRISRTLLAATFAAAVAICEVAAQQSSDPSNSSPANAASATKASAGRTVADTQFMKEAAEGGMAEVALGRLAVEKASSGDVKKFGQRMVDDHSAAQKIIELPQDLSAKDKPTKSTLESLSGRTIRSGLHGEGS